jgi:hypothetical protein
MGPDTRFAWVACAALAFAAPAEARQSVEVKGVRVVASSPLPARPYGFRYVVLDLENEKDEPRNVTLELGHAPDSPTPAVFERKEELASGERRRLEVVLPVNRVTASIPLVVTVGDRSRTSKVAPIGNRYLRAVVVASEAPRPAAAPQTLQGGRLDRYTIGFESLSADHRAYDGSDVLVIDATGKLPPQRVMAALATHVRGGGCLAFFGRDVADLRADLPEFAPWLTKRFHLSTFPDGDVYGCGFGSLIVAKSESAADVPMLDGVRQDGRRVITQGAIRRGLVSRLWLPSPAARSSDLAAPPRIEDREIPQAAVASMLVVMALWVGPVSALRARRRPVSLLWRVPLAAILGSLAITCYSLFVFRIAPTATSSSIELLDVASGRLVTIERRLQISGAFGGEELAPEAATDFGFARGEVVERPTFGGFAPVGQVPSSLRVTEDSSGRWRFTGYLPARRTIEHLLRSERPHGGSVACETTPDGLVVKNLLDVTLRDVVARGADATMYASGPGEEIAPGQSLRLAPLDEGTAWDAGVGYGFDLRNGGALFRQRIWETRERLVPARTLMAKTSGPLHRDDLDIEVGFQAGTHAVIVVLPDPVEEDEER